MIRLTIRKDGKTVEECLEFAEKRVAQKTNYKNKANLKYQIFCGTLFEFAVQRYLQKLGYKCCDPDTNIYQTNKKTHGADLLSSLGKIHCKTHCVNDKYKVSWCYANGKYISKDYHALGTIKECNIYFEIYIYGIYDGSNFNYNLLKPGTKWKSKKYLYWDDIKHINRIDK